MEFETYREANKKAGVDYKTKWHPWFALLPVPVADKNGVKKWEWLTTVLRKGKRTGSGHDWASFKFAPYSDDADGTDEDSYVESFVEVDSEWRAMMIGGIFCMAFALYAVFTVVYCATHKYNSGYSTATIESKTIQPQQEKNKEEEMGLTLGTWVMIIVVMVVVAKTVHRLNLKTIFRPSKRAARHVKKEWDES